MNNTVLECATFKEKKETIYKRNPLDAIKTVMAEKTKLKGEVLVLSR